MSETSNVFCVSKFTDLFKSTSNYLQRFVYRDVGKQRNCILRIDIFSAPIMITDINVLKTIEF